MTTKPTITDTRVHNQHPGTLINWFDSFDGPNNYRFLSNFYECNVVINGRTYLTTEHAYQAAKACGERDFDWVASAPSPGESKRRGRQIALRGDWEAIKYDVMVTCLRAKFFRGTELAAALLATGHAVLIEGTHWGDEVWGIDLDTKGTPGNNWLGTLLMARRAELGANAFDTSLVDRPTFQFPEY